jgi:two-component system, cell cycle response regulator CpdR
MSDHDETVLPIATGPLVLVVADDLTHRSIVTRMVRTMGFRVRSCPGSTAALAFLHEHPREVALLLTDLALERIDGYELCERARDLVPGLQVVLMVNLSGPYIDELIDQIPFVVKPVHFGELIGLLYDFLGQPTRRSQPRPIRRAPRRRSSGQYEG